MQGNELLDDSKLFSVYRFDRVGRRGGGVRVLAKATVDSYLVPVHCSLELVCVNLSLPFGRTILIACYRQQDSDCSFVDELYSVLLHLQSLYRSPR